MWRASAFALCLGLSSVGFAASLTQLARMAGMEAYPVSLKAPALNLVDLAGVEKRAEHYHGKVVLLNFWATWCAPCRQEFPSLERLQHALGGKDFTVLAVAVADTEASIERFLDGRSVAFDVLLDGDRRAAQAWRAAGVPVTYLLDREGRLLAGRTGAQQWDAAPMRALIRQAMKH